MAPKKKGVKLDLGEFLGEWADDDQPANTGSTDLFASVGMAPSTSQAPVQLPNAPPYRARISNLSFESDEEDVRQFLRNLAVSSIRMPKDSLTQKAKGYAFVDFDTRESLADALKREGQQVAGRAVRVSLEAGREDRTMGDWRAGGGRGGRRDDEPDLDWSVRRAPTTVPRDPRPQRSFRPQFDEPDLDWGARRPTAHAPREPRAPRYQPRDEPDLDWGSRRTPTVTKAYSRPPRREPREDPDLDWSRKRAPAANRAPQASSNPDRKPIAQKSSFAVLSHNQGSDSDDEPAAHKPSDDTANAPIPLSKTIAAANAANDDEWKTVGKH